MKNSMKRAGVALAVLAASAGARAEDRREGLDWSLGFQGRAKPLGAIFTGTVGHGFLLWDAGGRWQYGYIRPSFEVETIAVNTRVGAKLDIFPVSIFGISFKNEYGMRLSDPSYLDCEANSCDGGMWRTSVEARLGLEAAGVFALLGAKWMEIAPLATDRPFYEDRAVLIGIPGGDATVNLLAVTGYKLDDRWSVGVMDEWKRMRGTGHRNNLAVAFGMLRKSDWSYIAGAGYYSSEDSPPGLTAVMSVSWTGQKGIGLF